jgi:hypothetical protein
MEGLSVVDDSGTGGAGGLLAVLFPLDSLVNLFAMYRDVFGGVDTNAYLVSLHAQNGHRNFVSDHYGFANSSRQYQHKWTPNFLGKQGGQLTALNFRITTDVYSTTKVAIESPWNFSIRVTRLARILERRIQFLHIVTRINKSFN